MGCQRPSTSFTPECPAFRRTFAEGTFFMAQEVNLPRRFYAKVTVEQREMGIVIGLDGRVPTTPRGRPLGLPTQALATLIAAEWGAQSDFIQWASMPATRLAYTAIDQIAQAREATTAELMRYGENDVICYLAEGPESLRAQQEAEWGAVRQWAAQHLGITLLATTGLVHRTQPAESLARLAELAEGKDDFALAGLAFGAPLFGSAILSLALAHGAFDGDQAFALSRLDAAFQEAQWGIDPEAAARTEAQRLEARMLAAWFAALR